MRPSLSLPVRLTPPLLLLGLATFLAPSPLSKACSPETRCAWQRTFYAYNAFDYPLPPYFIPRTPGCIRGDYAGDAYYGNYGCSDGQAAGRWNYPPQAAIGLESVELERLGQVPNDMAALGLSGVGNGTGPDR
jgi:hypothetical protein